MLLAATSALALDARRKTELLDLVRQDCGSCHGMTMKGGLGRPLLPEQIGQVPSESLAAIILDGVPERQCRPGEAC